INTFQRNIGFLDSGKYTLTKPFSCSGWTRNMIGIVDSSLTQYTERSFLFGQINRSSSLTKRNACPVSIKWFTWNRTHRLESLKTRHDKIADHICGKHYHIVKLPHLYHSFPYGNS